MTKRKSSKTKLPKPIIEQMVEYSFMDIVYYVVDVFPQPNTRDIFWQHACNYWSLNNDSYLSYCLDAENEDDDPDLDKILNFVHKKFIAPHKGKNVLFYVCW